MYEPKFLPPLEDAGFDLSYMRYAVKHTSVYRAKDDIGVEGAHIHPYLEIFFNLGKEVSFLIGGTLYSVGSGEAVISRANDIHVCIYNSDADYEFFCFWIDIDEKSPLLSFVEGEDFQPHLSFDAAEWRAIISILDRLEQWGEGDSPLERCMLLSELLFAVEGAMGKKEALRVSIPEALARIIADVDENYACIRSVFEIGERNYVSSATLGRWFKKYVRITPREYLESKKLSEAARLLSAGESVTEACFGAGFSDTSHFIGLFKRKFGSTPLAYKRALLEKKIQN